MTLDKGDQPRTAMPDPVPGTVESDRPPEPETPAAAAVPFGAPGGGAPKAGDAWQRFELVSEVPDAPHTWLARDAARDERVVIQARLLDDAIGARRTTWAQLCALNHPRVLRCIDAYEEGSWRYEVTVQPSSLTLREWIACHQSGIHEIEAFIRQLAPAIEALHARGVGHFNLSPDGIFINELEGEPSFVVGALSAATLVDQPHLIPVAVDPFYAPPEAAGLTQHPPGVRLYAWDWWSLGRIVQQFLVGRHVLGLLLDRDVSRPTPELRQRAELLLLEREPPGVRAGAVEHMTAEPASVVLLRGLLTGSCDARWGAEAVQRWLKGEQPKEYYDLPRTARLWIWEGHAFTLADAAERFTQTAHWSAGEAMLFELDRPESLGHFLRETPAYREDWDRLQAVQAMTESGGWQQIDAATRRIVATAIGWLALTNGSGARGAFRVMGQTIDSPGLAELLKHPGGAQGVALLNALLLPAVIEYLETLDSTAARVLKGLAAKGGGAVRLALEHGWLNPQDDREFARLLHLSLERTVILQDRHTLLQSGYATSRHAELARILGEKNPSPAELVVSAFTGEATERFGYVTHRDWRHQRFLELRAQADGVASALLWLRLRQLLAVARLWGAPWPVFSGLSMALAALAGWLTRSFSSGALVAILLLLGRVWLVVRVRQTFRRCRDGSAPWSWRDGLGRARAEADQVVARTQVSPLVLAQQLRTLQTSLLQFGTLARGGITHPHWWDLAAVFALATVITLAVLVQGWLTAPVAVPRAAGTPEPVAAVVAARRPAHVETLTGHGPTERVSDPEALLATGRYEVVNDGFGRRLRGPLQPWTQFSPPVVAPLVVAARAPAKPTQAAFASVSATLILQPYVRTSVVGLLAIPVPTTRGFGIMVYNARDRLLLDHQVVLIERPLPLQDGTWYELDHKRVFFRQSPLPLDSEIPLAPW